MTIYEIALEEVKAGKKKSHWIWFIFPQIVGLGRSSMANKYALTSLDEAREYYNNEILHNRLFEITNAMLELSGDVRDIFGYTDAMKVCSCMTLFDLVSPNDIFAKVLKKFYGDRRCLKTLDLNK